MKPTATLLCAAVALVCLQTAITQHSDVDSLLLCSSVSPVVGQSTQAAAASWQQQLQQLQTQIQQQQPIVNSRPITTLQQEISTALYNDVFAPIPTPAALKQYIATQLREIDAKLNLLSDRMPPILPAALLMQSNSATADDAASIDSAMGDYGPDHPILTQIRTKIRNWLTELKINYNRYFSYDYEATKSVGLFGHDNWYESDDSYHGIGWEGVTHDAHTNDAYELEQQDEDNTDETLATEDAVDRLIHSRQIEPQQSQSDDDEYNNASNSKSMNTKDANSADEDDDDDDDEEADSNSAQDSTLNMGAMQFSPAQSEKNQAWQSFKNWLSTKSNDFRRALTNMFDMDNKNTQNGGYVVTDPNGVATYKSGKTTVATPAAQRTYAAQKKMGWGMSAADADLDQEATLAQPVESETLQQPEQEQPQQSVPILAVRRFDGVKMTPAQTEQYEISQLSRLNVPALQQQFASMHQLLDSAIDETRNSAGVSRDDAQRDNASADSIDGLTDRQPDMYGESDAEYSKSRVIMSRIVEQAKNIGWWFSGFFHWSGTPERNGYW